MSVGLLIARSWVRSSPVVSLSKTLHFSYLVLVKHRMSSQNDSKIFDRDVKPQTKKQQTNKVRMGPRLDLITKCYMKKMQMVEEKVF